MKQDGRVDTRQPRPTVLCSHVIDFLVSDQQPRVITAGVHLAVLLSNPI